VDALFNKTFRPLFHVIGEPAAQSEDEPEIMVPEPNCDTLCVSADPGDSKNFAATIFEKTFQVREMETKQGLVKVTVPVLKYLDELVVIDEHYSLEEFTVDLMVKMAFWEAEIGRPGNTMWSMWADSNIFDRQSPESKRYVSQIIYDASVLALEQGIVKLSGPLIFQAAEKGPGSVQARVDLWRRLLFDERLFIGREKCPGLIQMCKSLKKGKSQIQPIQKGSPHKHVFDAATYGAGSELHEEMARSVVTHLMNKRRSSEGSVVTVPL
jgi:hypothetical protein